MSAKWCVGTIALCIRDDWPRSGGNHPRKGSLLTVTSMIRDERGVLFLWFGPGEGYQHDHFVPISPPSQQREFERVKERVHGY